MANYIYVVLIYSYLSELALGRTENLILIFSMTRHDYVIEYQQTVYTLIIVNCSVTIQH